MQPGIYIEMDILSSLICILLFYQQRRHKVFDFLGTTAFNTLLWSAVGIMVVDIVSWLMMGNIVPHSDGCLLAVQSLYYAIQAVLPLFFMIYCVNTSGRTFHGIWRVLMYVPLLITLVTIVVNAFNGFAFRVVDNHVVRADAFLMSIFSAMVYLLASVLLCTVFYIRSRRETVERQKISFHILICVIISTLGAVACVFVNYISPWHVFVSALIYLYMQLHSYQEHSLDRQATRDSLTGLKNHAIYTHIKENMDETIGKDPSHRFAVAVMDVNGLKQVNDLYGHKAGDALIIAASRLMCEVFRHSPVCRIGGDEFVAILEKGDYENREELRELFNQRLKTAVFYVDGKELPVTVALGMVAYLPDCHTAFEDVFHAADEAMYLNKAETKKLQ